MLTIIGLGLGGPNSITMDGVIALSLSEHIFYETYTSPIHSDTLEWIKLKSEKEPIHLSRSQVEEPKELIDLAKKTNVSLLIVGDSLSATTHVSLLLEKYTPFVKIDYWKYRRLLLDKVKIDNADICTKASICNIPGILGSLGQCTLKNHSSSFKSL